MGNGRQDVQRLFGHFGLDPADYIVSFARAADAPVTSKSAGGNAEGERRGLVDRDLFDCRSYDLG